MMLRQPNGRFDEAKVFGPYQALLFDMDGTLLTSTAAVERAWHAWSVRSALPAIEVFNYLFGRRASDTIDYFLPGVSPERRQQEIDWVEWAEMSDMSGIGEVPGARAFLSSLPARRWAIATSATRRLAIKRIEAAGLPLPAVLIAADDVAVGKPDPSAYLLAAERLGVDPGRCLVFEDMPAGVAAGLASGAEVAVVANPGEAPNPAVRLVVEDYRDLAVEVTDDGLNLRHTRTR